MKAFSFLLLCIFLNAISAVGQEYESITPLLKLDSIRYKGGGALNSSVSFRYFNGKVIEEKHYTADPHSNNNPEYSFSYKYFYNSDNTLRYIKGRIYKGTSSKYDSISYSYNTNGLIAEILSYSINSATSVLNQKQNYFYNVNNRIDSIIELDNVNNQWVISNKTIYTYRTDGKLIKTANAGKITFYFYNLDGSINYHLVYKTTDTLFLKPESKMIYFPNGQLTKDVITYGYVNDTTQYVANHSVSLFDTTIRANQMYLPIWYNDSYKLVNVKSYMGSGNTSPLVTTSYFYSSAIVGVDINSKISNVSLLSPNPFSNKLFLNEEFENNVYIKLFDAQGTLVYEGHDKIIDTEYFLNGLYFYQIVDGSKTYTGKIIK